MCKVRSWFGSMLFCLGVFGLISYAYVDIPAPSKAVVLEHSCGDAAIVIDFDGSTLHMIEYFKSGHGILTTVDIVLLEHTSGSVGCAASGLLTVNDLSVSNPHRARDSLPSGFVTS